MGIFQLTPSNMHPKLAFVNDTFRAFLSTKNVKNSPHAVLKRRPEAKKKCHIRNQPQINMLSLRNQKKEIKLMKLIANQKSVELAMTRKMQTSTFECTKSVGGPPKVSVVHGKCRWCTINVGPIHKKQKSEPQAGNCQ